MATSLTVARIGERDGRCVAYAASIGAVSSLLFVVFAFIVPAGLPYDEPSHFSTVEYYAHEHRLPVMGDPGVSYEAQNGPVYYASAAASFEAIDSLASREVAFYATRLFGLIVWCAALWLTFLCVRGLLGPSEGVAAVALIGLNPALLAVASSVQNDSLAIALCIVALLLAIRGIDRRDTSVRLAAAFGVLSGVAVMTKLHSAFVVAPAFVAIVVAAARDRLKLVVACVGSAVIVSAWWFLRNLDLYGDFTGRSGVRRTGVEFPAEELTPGGVWRFARGVFGYLWTPAEYHRNLIDTPRWIEAAVIILSAIVVVGLLRSRPRFTRAGTAMTAVAAVFCVALAVLYFTVSTLAGRLLYPLAPLYAAVLIIGFRGWGPRAGRALVVLTVAVQVLLTVIVLRDLDSLPDGPWAIAL